jgi:sugar lactone lactonase YvrE
MVICFDCAERSPHSLTEDLVQQTRQLRKRLLVVGIALTLPFGLALSATGPMSFEPIAGSAYGQLTNAWIEPFIIPNGFTQQLVLDETNFDIYAGGVDDLTDMNTVNETGPHSGRYLYRTHEVGTNGSVSVIDLKTGFAKILDMDPGYRRLDGLRWTPWGTLLFAEETTGGRLFELFLDPKDRTTMSSVETRAELGILRHEGIGVDNQGNVYVIDELNGGSIFRFVPTTRGDLSDGQLYALKLTNLTDAEQLWDPTTFNQKVGPFEWVPLDMAQVVVDADVAANDVDATEFGRPEDVEIIGHVLYVANTSEDRVVAIDLQRNMLTSFVQAGLNVPIENSGMQITGFNNPDNLASGPDGKLWIVEDNVPSDIWVAGRDQNKDGAADTVDLFASLKDSGAEGTGIYFGKNPRTLYVNVQHPAKPLADGTWAISQD